MGVGIGAAGGLLSSAAVAATSPASLPFAAMFDDMLLVMMVGNWHALTIRRPERDVVRGARCGRGVAAVQFQRAGGRKRRQREQSRATFGYGSARVGGTNANLAFSRHERNSSQKGSSSCGKSAGAGAGAGTSARGHSQSAISITSTAAASSTPTQAPKERRGCEQRERRERG